MALMLTKAQIHSLKQKLHTLSDEKLIQAKEALSEIILTHGALQHEIDFLEAIKKELDARDEYRVDST